MVGSSWSPKQVKDHEEKRLQYNLERGAPNDFLPGSGYESPTKKKVVLRKWKPSTPAVESQRVDSWIGGSPMEEAQKKLKKRSYKIIREIPPPQPSNRQSASSSLDEPAAC